MSQFAQTWDLEIAQEDVSTSVMQADREEQENGAARHPAAAGVALLYGYLYLLLMNEDYALLIGSIGLFAILGASMFVTRRVDWYAVGTRVGTDERNARTAI